MRAVALGCRRWVAVLAAVVVVASSTHACPFCGLHADTDAKAPAASERFESSSSQRREIIRAIAADELLRASQLIETYLVAHRNDAEMLYTAACLHAQLGNLAQAESLLFKAVEEGFLAFDAMQRDPDLEPIRESETYLAIVEANRRVTATPGEQLFERFSSKFGEGVYRLDRDETRQLYYATCLDDITHREVREMLESQADYLVDTLFGDVPGYAVLVAMPTPQHARSLLGHDNVGGMYFHHKRELITRDVGGSLRHEFFHLMHYGHMERLRQKHPLWIQEGLACLFEDYRLEMDGSIEFLPNERHAEVKRSARGRQLPTWSELFTMDDKLFMREAAKNYAMVRSIFEFVAERGKLETWYAAYTAGFAQDTTGRHAFEQVFQLPIDEVERQWRQWVIARPDVRTTVRPGSASLGVQIQPNAVSDGVLVTEVFDGSAAARSGIERRDVIVAVDGEAVRSGQELTRRIASKLVGDVVSIRVRRDGRYLDFAVKLQAYGRRTRSRIRHIIASGSHPNHHRTD